MQFSSACSRSLVGLTLVLSASPDAAFTGQIHSSRSLAPKRPLKGYCKWSVTEGAARAYAEVVIIAELWRYPVKSMGGERLLEAGVTETGIEGDRGWGVVDLLSGKVLTAKRESRLLFARARLLDADTVEVRLPDGSTLESDDQLTRWLERPVALRRAGETGGHFENPRDFEAETDWVSWQGPPKAWHDMRRARLSIVSRATLRDWDPRRFRANIILDACDEDALVGRQVRLGELTLDVTKQIDRCVMVTRPQPGLEKDLDILRVINRERDTFLGVGALVVAGGRLVVGDVLQDIVDAVSFGPDA